LKVGSRKIGKKYGLKAVLLCLVAFLSATAAIAQEAPAPNRMPRTPVSRQTLVEPHVSIPSSREIQGTAAIIDGEKLRIGQTDLRLFGIAAPQLTASFGPQARAQLDAMAGGQIVSCKIRDRDRDGRLLATCSSASGSDMALELLRRGLAVMVRGSVAGTEVVTLYTAAEQAAQNQKIGLWSTAISAPAAIPTTALTHPQPKTETPAPAVESKKEDKPAVTEQQATIKTAANVQAQAKVSADILSQQVEEQKEDEAWAAKNEISIFERFQILISGLLMLTTAICIIGAFEAQRIRDKIDEIKALAAALRGELMAARSVCLGRAKSITCDADDRTAVWPRIRSTLYQAYVGRLGMLGAELARQVASVYGQTSDYAALYNPVSGTFLEVTKKQALETLVRRIDEVLPKLAQVERTGKIPFSSSALPQGAEKRSAASPKMAMGISSLITSGALSVFKVLDAAHSALRSFAMTSSAVAAAPEKALPPEPPHVTEYTAIIEADMERHQYVESIETIETIESSENIETLTQPKKRKPRSA